MRIYFSAVIVVAMALFASTASAEGSIAESLRRYFAEISVSAGADARVHGQALGEKDALSRHYKATGYRPLWVEGGILSDRVDALLAAIRASAEHGLPLHRYHLVSLQAYGQNPAELSPLEAELLLSDAFMLQIRHRAMGVTLPHALNPDWGMAKQEMDLAQTFAQTIRHDNPIAVLDDFWPDNDEYRRLVERRRFLARSQDTRSRQVGGGALLRKGATDPRVEQLKQRLYGPGDYDVLFDDRLEAALTAFQRGAGLEADGILGPQTLDVLNARRVDWIDRLDANLERWRWLPARLPKTYIRVNLAAFQLRVLDSGQDVLQMDIIGGRVTRKTPVIAEAMRYIVFSPYWNVPTTIAVEDKLPLLQRDPDALDKLGYEVLLRGEATYSPVSRVNWTKMSKANFDVQLRQRPGPMNALGGVKFMLPNKHAVYLHDTPNKELFARAQRDFSSGCIRLSQPAQLAQWVIGHDGQQLSAPIDDLMGRDKPVTVHLKSPLPVWIVYFTAFTDAFGELQFRRDVYERDATIVSALRQ